MTMKYMSCIHMNHERVFLLLLGCQRFLSAFRATPHAIRRRQLPPSNLTSNALYCSRNPCQVEGMINFTVSLLFRASDTSHMSARRFIGSSFKSLKLLRFSCRSLELE